MSKEMNKIKKALDFIQKEIEEISLEINSNSNKNNLNFLYSELKEKKAEIQKLKLRIEDLSESESEIMYSTARETSKRLRSLLMAGHGMINNMIINTGNPCLSPNLSTTPSISTISANPQTSNVQVTALVSEINDAGSEFPAKIHSGSQYPRVSEVCAKILNGQIKNNSIENIGAHAQMASKAKQSISHIQDLHLADPTHKVSSQIEIILGGALAFDSLFRHNKIDFLTGTHIPIATTLDHILLSNYKSALAPVLHSGLTGKNSPQVLISKQWKLENISPSRKLLPKNDRHYKDLFAKSKTFEARGYSPTFSIKFYSQINPVKLKIDYFIRIKDSND